MLELDGIMEQNKDLVKKKKKNTNYKFQVEYSDGLCKHQSQKKKKKPYILNCPQGDGETAEIKIWHKKLFALPQHCFCSHILCNTGCKLQIYSL